MDEIRRNENQSKETKRWNIKGGVASDVAI
jgi:hypothetical protein